MIIRPCVFWLLDKKNVRSDTILGGPKKLQTMRVLSIEHQLMFFSSCSSWPSSSPFCSHLQVLNRAYSLSCNPMDCRLPRLLSQMGFFRQEPWSEFPFPTLTQGSNPSLCLLVAGIVFTAESSRKKSSSCLYFVWSLPIPSLLPSHQHRILLTDYVYFFSPSSLMGVRMNLVLCQGRHCNFSKSLIRKFLNPKKW